MNPSQTATSAPLHPAKRPYLSRWWYAAKPSSWPKLLVPILLGTGMGADAVKKFDYTAFGISLLFTCFLLLFIVFLNDWGDQKVDQIKRTMFPEGCSPKTIPDGILSSKALLFAGILTGLLALSTATLGSQWLGRPWLGLGGIFCLGIFVAYSLPPLHLNYRGHGELLETLGTGLALPLWGFYAQSGSLWSIHFWCLLGWCALCFASALASGLSDEESDREGGKTTYTTRFGNQVARRWIYASAFGGCALWFIFPALLSNMGYNSRIPVVPWLVIIVGSGTFLQKAKEYDEKAVTNAFSEINTYKKWLHYAIWWGGGSMGLLWIVRSFLAD